MPIHLKFSRRESEIMEILFPLEKATLTEILGGGNKKINKLMLETGGTAQLEAIKLQ